MTDQHPINPPLEVVQYWVDALLPKGALNAFTVAAQWGADQELKACCTEVSFWGSKGMANKLRIARRPKPPSLKEQALEQLECIQTDLNKFGMGISTDTIRRALEALPE